MAEYAGLPAPPASSSAGTPRGCPAGCGGTEPAEGSPHRHERTQAAKQLRGSAWTRVSADRVRGPGKEESAVEGLGRCEGQAASGPTKQKCDSEGTQGAGGG